MSSSVSGFRSSVLGGTGKASVESLNIPIHGLRGVAAMMVFVGHLLGGTAEHIYADRSGYVAGAEAFWNFGFSGVMLFFMISGFVILPSVLKYEPGEFALRRFLRLYPLFLFSTVIFASINGLTNWEPEKNNAESIFFSLTFLDLFTTTRQVAPNAWTLTFEVMFYSVACFTHYFLTRDMNRSIKIILLLIPICFFLRWPITSFFIFGALIYWIRPAQFVRSRNLRHIIEICGLLAYINFASQINITFHWEDFDNALPFLIMMSMFVYLSFAVAEDSITAFVLGNRFTLYLGTVSYSLYLIHPYTYFSLRGFFAGMDLFSDDIALSMTVFCVITIAITIPVTHVVHVIFERLPYQWYFKQRLYRRHASAITQS